jgi:hypothetical protein
MKLASTLIILTSLMVTPSLQAKWGRIPVMQTKPVNIAVKGPHSPVSIDSSSGVGQVDNLINGVDVTASASVAVGKSYFILSFGKPVMVSNSSIVNDGVEGKITLSASADKNGWAVLEEKVVSAADREINFKFAGIQAKFLKYDMVLSKGGSLRTLSVYGSQTNQGYALRQDAKGEKGQPMNFIGGLGGARLVYAAPKPVNGIDSAAAFNKFEFPETDEQYRTLIYDLGNVRVLNEFSSVHSPAPVRFEVFAFDKLPEKEDWRGRLAFDPADFNVVKPVVTYEDKVGHGHLKVKPTQPVKTRYLALRWEPDFNPPAFVISSVGGSGNVMQVATNYTQTVTLADGSKATVTFDVGSGELNGSTISVAITKDGVTTKTTYTGVDGVNISGNSIQVLKGAPPNSPGAVAGAVAGTATGTGTQQIVGQTQTNTNGSVEMVTSSSDIGGNTNVSTSTTTSTTSGTSTTQTSTSTTTDLGALSVNPAPTNTTAGQNPNTGGTPVTPVTISP